MTIKDRAQLEASIDRYRRGFWNRESMDRPPFSVLPDRAWLPLLYLREPLRVAEFQPDDIGPKLARSDYEDAAEHRAVTVDDWMPWAAPWRGVPWLEAIAGCSVLAAQGSLAPGAWADSIEQLRDLREPRGKSWFDRLGVLTAELQETAPDDCFVSTSIFRGPSDVLAAARGLTNFYLDIVDEPEVVAEAALAVNQMHLAVLARHLSIVKPKMGGYGHIYGYWSPEPTTMIQDDVLGMTSPATFRDYFSACAAEIVKHLGSHVIYHVHSTGFGHWRHLLDVPGLAGVELGVEPIGPSLHELEPMLLEIAERSRLLLMVDGHFDEFTDVVRKLPTDGVCVGVSDKFVKSDAEYRDLMAATWPGAKDC
jgi:hypothetical protein